MRLTAVIAAAFVVAAAPAWAAAPQPARPAPASLYAGRWYEIARTPNLGQRDCLGASSEFSGGGGAEFEVVQTCHHGSPSGPAQVVAGHCRILPGAGGAKLVMSFFGGVISQEYWILDRADDFSWVIMATPGGHYVWLLSRRPALDATSRAQALARIAALGYDTRRLAFPQQQATR